MAPSSNAHSATVVHLARFFVLIPIAKSSLAQDSVLMQTVTTIQTHQALDKTFTNTSAETGLGNGRADRSASHAAAWLGWSRNLAAGDYWNLEHLGGESIFKKTMPGSCYEDSHCSHSSHFESHHFNSINSWSHYYSNSFGVELSGGFRDFAATVEMSVGENAGLSGGSSLNLSYASKTVHRTCYRLVTDSRCAYNRSHLQPAFLQRLELQSLQTGSPYTADKMEAWNTGFVQRFGTHVTIGSSHGAEVQSLFTVEARSKLSRACLDTKLCLGFNWLSSVGLNFCNNRAACDGDNSSAVIDARTCAALGGDPKLQLHICAGNVSQETLNEWMQGGNMQTGSSIYRYTFMPIQDFLTNLDYDEFADTAATLKKSVEYSSCRIDENPRLQRWQPSGGYQRVVNTTCAAEGMSPIVDVQTCRQAARSFGISESDVSTGNATGCHTWRDPSLQSLCSRGEFECQCVRQCANGGVLDVDSCTCQCPGDKRHGWKGPECREAYGSCQAGAASTNKAVAEKCAVNNQCGTLKHKARCGPADICCAAHIGSQCCPFGSSCSCTWGECQCATEP